MGDARLCVMCRTHPVDPKYHPFCSARCQIRDLAKWADGGYRIAADPPSDDDKQDDDAKSEV